MHENRYMFLFLIEINNMHRTRHIYQYPGPVFGAGAAGAVFRIMVLVNAVSLVTRQLADILFADIQLADKPSCCITQNDASDTLFNNT